MESYDFRQIVTLSTDWLLNKLSEEIIFRYYFGQEIKLGKAYNCPFTRDRNPSTWFFRNAKGKLIYFDCRTGEKLDCFGYVKKLYGGTFQEVLKRIASDFGLLNDTKSIVPSRIVYEASRMEKENKERSLIQFISDDWSSKHLKYWQQFEITKEELVHHNVYPVKRLFLNKNEIFNPQNYLRFAYPQDYVTEKGEKKTGVKIYSPYDKGNKWTSSLPLHIPFGVDKLNYVSNRLFITKSKKDLIVLHKWFPDVIATQNESVGAFPEKLQKEMLNAFDIAIINFDADPTGVKSSTVLTEKGFKYFNTPKEDYEKYGIKDVADYIKIYGKELTEELFKKYNLL